MELEREANPVRAFAPVFPAERYPFPADDVLARWRLVLDEPSAEVLVAWVDDPDDDADGLVAYAAYDDDTLRYLAVRPDHWGRGLATAAIETVLHAMDLREPRPPPCGCSRRTTGPAATLRVPRLAAHRRGARGALAAVPAGDGLHPAHRAVRALTRAPGCGILEDPGRSVARGAGLRRCAWRSLLAAASPRGRGVLTATVLSARAWRCSMAL